MFGVKLLLLNALFVMFVWSQYIDVYFCFCDIFSLLAGLCVKVQRGSWFHVPATLMNIINDISPFAPGEAPGNI